MSRLSSWRMYLLFSVFVLAAGGIGARLFLLQIVHGEYYAALAQARNVPLNQVLTRGEIYFQDPQRGQQSIAGNQATSPSPYFHAVINEDDPLLYASPNEIKNLDSVVALFSPIINISANDLRSKLSHTAVGYVPLVHQASQDIVKQAESAALQGIHITTESVRKYPAGELAAHVLGFLGYNKDGDRAGQYGVEQYYNDTLSGVNEPLGTSAGANLELTIDYNIQYMVQKKLEDVVSQYHAKGGSVVIVDPKTGAILAMASVPSFDPNSYASAKDPAVFMNRAIQEVYEPGSIMKALTMASAVDAGVVTPDTTYIDPGIIHIDGYTIQNFDNQAHGQKTMREVLELSLNTGAVFAEQKLGNDKFLNYLKAFQINTPTGVDLSGEVAGSLQGLTNNPHDVNFETAAFGQGVSVTTLEFLKAFASLGNNGTMMKPYVVKTIHYPDGTTKNTQPEVVGQPISAQTAATMTSMLVDVVNKGYDHHGGVPGYNVAGKTGTAQIPCTDGRGYCGQVFHSFAGYSPASNPVFAGLITMEAPQGIAFASSSLAPVFGDIASYILQYYHAPAR